MSGQQQPYLQPYLEAAARHGSGFGSLLWASPTTQAARFDAIRRIGNLHGMSLLDVGCGRADLLAYLIELDVRPLRYFGIEAVDALADAADARGFSNATIFRADFVAEPLRLFVGAEVVILCGSLNTADDSVFYSTLSHAFEAASGSLIFNFLSSPELAGRDYLFWRRPAQVMSFARSLSSDVSTIEDYLTGDMTVRIGK